MDNVVNILLVDDQPGNLDALEAILSCADYNLVRAQSAEQALLALLHREFAAVVLDIRMPGVSGLELAALIKSRKRTQHVPILFLTAHLLDETDVLRGYGAGAVDYLSKPINPEILRSKIAVFVDLFRKAREIASANRALQAEIAERQRAQEALRTANDALETRVRERTSDLVLANHAMRESEQRVRLLLDAVGDGIIGLDAEGHVVSINPAAATLLGVAPDELIGRTAERMIPAAALTGEADGTSSSSGQATLRRRDGTTFPAELGRTVMRNEEGVVTGQVLVFRDLSAQLLAQRRLAAEHSVTRILAGATVLDEAASGILARLCENLDVPIGELWVPDEGQAALYRVAAHIKPDRTIDRGADESDEGAQDASTFPADVGLAGRVWRSGEPCFLAHSGGEFGGQRWAGDTRLRGAWGFPILDHDRCEGVVCLYSDGPTEPDEMLMAMMGAVGRELGAFVRRTRAEAELRAHHERLEDLVRKRTQALERSHDRLRQAERLAAIGTLATGLGHDLSNLLLPIRARLRGLTEAGLGPSAAADVEAIGEAVGYLQRLASGLRMLALDPESESPGEPQTDLSSWWRDMEGACRAPLPRGVRLVASFPAQLPRLAIPAARLTQAVFNLVQNAAEALAGSASARTSGDPGTITISASLHDGQPSGDSDEDGAVVTSDIPLTEPHVMLAVADDGPGMSGAVAERCFEPYFSTKVRAVSTGMGLPLVRAWVERAGGSVRLTTSPGRGTTFELHLPVVSAPTTEAAGQSQAPRVRAALSLADDRTGNFIAAMLDATRVSVSRWDAESSGVPDADIWIADSAAAAPERIAEFLARHGSRRAVILSEPGATDSDDPGEPASGERPAAARVWRLPLRPSTQQLRHAIVQACSDDPRHTDQPAARLFAAGVTR